MEEEGKRGKGMVAILRSVDKMALCEKKKEERGTVPVERRGIELNSVNRSLFDHDLHPRYLLMNLFKVKG